jgi:hypothetical protein
MLHLQTIIALVIVIVTLMIFVVRMLKPKPKGGCGHDCGCDRSPGKPHIHRD